MTMKEVKVAKKWDGFPLISLQEINILVSLCHPSIVKLNEVVVKDLMLLAIYLT